MSNIDKLASVVAKLEPAKRTRGGRRPGSGRKPNYFKRLAMPPITAALILAQHDEIEFWTSLLKDRSADIRLRTAMYLTDRRDGKPKQAVKVEGGLLHSHTVYRNPQLVALSQEELKQLDSLTLKLALPEAPPVEEPIEAEAEVETEETL